MFSSAKYPGDKTASYQHIFPEDDNSHDAQPAKLHKVSEKLQDFNSKTMQNKLQFYSFKAKTNSDDVVTGLGPVPGHLASASSLTVFNTYQCPYNDSLATSDPLDMVTKKEKHSVVVASENTVDNKDVSALHNDSDEAVTQSDIFYFPEMEDLPTFDLPDALELPNIATDLQVITADKSSF